MIFYQQFPYSNDYTSLNFIGNPVFMGLTGQFNIYNLEVSCLYIYNNTINILTYKVYYTLSTYTFLKMINKFIKAVVKLLET